MMTRKLVNWTRFAALGCAVALGSLAPAFAADRQVMPLDDTVTAIRLVGAETALLVRADSDADGAVSVMTENSIGCGLDARLTRDGSTLVITISKSGVTARWWCDPDLTVHLPNGLDLSVGLDNFVGDIRGDFAGIDIDSGMSIVNFTGRATRFHMKGAASIARLNFAADMRREDVDIDVPSLMSHVSFSGS